jgi:hypothetical protein
VVGADKEGCSGGSGGDRGVEGGLEEVKHVGDSEALIDLGCVSFLLQVLVCLGAHFTALGVSHRVLGRLEQGKKLG